MGHAKPGTSKTKPPGCVQLRGARGGRRRDVRHEEAGPAAGWTLANQTVKLARGGGRTGSWIKREAGKVIKRVVSQTGQGGSRGQRLLQEGRTILR